MPRSKKLKPFEVPCNVDLPQEVSAAIDAFCERHRFKKKNLVELALRNFLATHQAVKK